MNKNCCDNSGSEELEKSESEVRDKETRELLG
jgi:hypothetical protein